MTPEFLTMRELQQKWFSKLHAFEPENRITTIVGPLKDAKVDPDVKILVGRPETVYWIIPVIIYCKRRKGTL